MHMTSQKGTPACWGSNEALSRAPSPSMQPAGQPLHAILPGRPWPAHWLRAPTLFQHSTCAQRDKSWPPTWHRCYGDMTSMHKVYSALTHRIGYLRSCTLRNMMSLHNVQTIHSTGGFLSIFWKVQHSHSRHQNWQNTIQNLLRITS